ncbi:hypothetical protein OAA38_00220 [bacterium]|nr:hypothetical protein [bacterium]
MLSLGLSVTSSLTSIDGLVRGPYSEGGLFPRLALDFDDNKYATDVGPVTFADAFTAASPKLTYSTTSNSTMTQGYGPELVTNGGFDTDTSGWTDASEGTGSTSWYASGALSLNNPAGSPLEEGMAYQVITTIVGQVYTLAVSKSGGNSIIQIGNNSGGSQVYQSGNDTVDVLTTFIAISTTTYITARNFNVSTPALVDNISVREAPKIVWAPHNLVPNSEDFRASGPSSPWVHQNSATITENAITAPDDGSNGTQLEFGAANNSQIRNDFGLGSTIQGTFTIRVWVKCATGTTEKVRLKSYSSGNGNQNSDDITVTDQWVLVSYSFVKSSGSSMSTYISNATDAVARTIFIWGAHVYRSDLGGMGQVPGAATGFEYYVPTNGAAKYLPRVGHHVYSGSAWVNEGLLIESEARTNLVTYSGDFSQWTASSGTTVTAGATSPAGQTDAYQITLAGNNDNVQLTTAGLSTSTAVQYSVYLRVSSGTQSVNLGNIDAGQYQSVTVTTEWQRFVITQTPSATTRFPRILNGTNDSFTVEAFGAQIEQNATASSYIPTTGASATRAAQTLVVPPAAFGWPEPEYIGSELVTNGGFATDSDWTKGTGWTINTTTGKAVHDEASGGGSIHQDVTVEVGKVYSVVYDIASEPVSGSGNTNTSIQIFDGPETSLIYGISNFNSPDYELFDGSLRYEAVVVPSVTTLRVRSFSDDAFSISNVSVREVNPLSVSIQMDGRMTFADEDQSLQHQLWNWKKDNNNLIRVNYDTHSTYGSGRISFQQVENNVYDLVNTGSNVLAPGTLVSFNIASRHGSTFTNAAVDGTALTEDATPTALPDLSASDLQIATDFMGTIRTFRQFAGDIGDAGLATATS